MSDNKPIHTMNYGNVRIGIWANPSPFGGFFYNVVPCRCFKNTKNKWSSTNGFGEFDLPMAAKALLDAHAWILAHKASQQEVIALPPPPPVDEAKSYTDETLLETTKLPKIQP